MRYKLLTGLFLLIALSFVPAVSWAHHSTAMFDQSKAVTYKGVITKMVWANPHCFIYFDGLPENAPANTPVEHWAVEGQSPSVMVEHGGWEEDTAKVGDTIVVTGNARRDGVPMMLLMSASIHGKTYQVLARSSSAGDKKY